MWRFRHCYPNRGGRRADSLPAGGLKVLLGAQRSAPCRVLDPYKVVIVQ